MYRQYWIVTRYRPILKMTYWNQYRKWNCGIGTSLGIMYYVSFLWWHLCFRLTYKLRCGVVWIKRIIVVRLYIHQIEKNDMQYFWHDVVSLKRSDSLCYNSMWEKQTHLLELFIKFIAKFLLKNLGIIVVLLILFLRQKKNC